MNAAAVDSKRLKTHMGSSNALKHLITPHWGYWCCSTPDKWMENTTNLTSLSRKQDCDVGEQIYMHELPKDVVR